jgi:membrane protein YqaA with SNARE-associated domain
MKIFSGLYDRALRWSAHPHAPRYLAAVSFAESSFFPLPPDALLAPMTLARPHMWWRYALLTTLMSVIGGMAGYSIGHFALEAVMPLLERAGYLDAYRAAHEWFARWGFWAIFAAGFTPIPYKVFTIAAGAANMALLPFAVGSAIGRGMRFCLVAALVRWGGPSLEPHLRRHVDTIGWACIALIVVAVLVMRL